ncbi:phosphatase PAP2 family protein [Mesoplasma chauliocola]|uniref:phosphatase PAP2 family protein n=1 Tax=Mesoplasma chauliocola TaxID=216427 RepID=UPI0004829D8C|nr:phosphatase PAP2 family protein [Mesoplasma chauliocola]
MFQTKNKNYLILKILLLSFFILTISLFIIGSFFDMQINTWFAQGMDNYSLKIIVWIYEELGMTQSFVFIFCFVAVILEVTYFSSNKSNKWKIILYIYYVAFLVYWITFNLIAIISAPNRNDGYGSGVNAIFFESQKIRQYILIFLFVIESLSFICLFYYLRFKFSKRQDLLVNGYRVDAIKAFVIFLLTSLVVWIMKPTFGRPYFYSVDFENIFYSEQMKAEWAQYWIQTGHTIKSWGYLNGTNVESVPYKEWWQVNDFFGNITSIFKPLGSGEPGWWNMDFPSGHMNSSFTILFAGYFFLGEKKKRKINWYKWVIIVIWFIHINIMQYTQIISRTHWITDTSFTISISLFALIINGAIIDKIISKYNLKHNKNFR